jgi:hypothetical protein
LLTGVATAEREWNPPAKNRRSTMKPTLHRNELMLARDHNAT